MADFLYGGFAEGEFAQPASVRAALAAASEDFDLSPEQRELDAKLAARGLRISNMSYPACPTGPEQWIKTKSSWPLCEERIGMRWRTPEGWCYPESLCAIDEADTATKELTVFRKLELFQRINAALNTVRQPQRDQWLQAKAEEFRKYKKPITLGGVKYNEKVAGGKDAPDFKPSQPFADMSVADQAEFYDLVQADMPAKFKDIPTAALMKTQHEDFVKLKAMAKANNKSGSGEGAIKKLVATMRSAGTVPPAGMDLEEYATEFYKESVGCADMSIGKRYADAKSACAAADACGFIDEGAEDDAICMPKTLAGHKDAWLRGESDELAGWYGELFDERRNLKAAEAAKVARALGGRSRVF